MGKLDNENFETKIHRNFVKCMLSQWKCVYLFRCLIQSKYDIRDSKTKQLTNRKQTQITFRSEFKRGAIFLCVNVVFCLRFLFKCR